MNRKDFEIHWFDVVHLRPGSHSRILSRVSPDLPFQHGPYIGMALKIILTDIATVGT